MPRTYGAVKPLRTHKQYWVPNTHPRRCAGWGYFATGVFRSVRTSGGRRYDGDDLAVLECIIGEIERDRLPHIQIQIDYNRLKKNCGLFHHGGNIAHAWPARAGCKWVGIGHAALYVVNRWGTAHRGQNAGGNGCRANDII